MEYIEGSVIKSSGKSFREHLKLLLRKKCIFSGKMAENDTKVTICYINVS